MKETVTKGGACIFCDMECKLVEVDGVMGHYGDADKTIFVPCSLYANDMKETVDDHTS